MVAAQERLLLGGAEFAAAETVQHRQRTGEPARQRQPVSRTRRQCRTIPICESVQSGLHSLGYRGGRFIVDEARSEISEHAVHDFQTKVLRALGELTWANSRKALWKEAAVGIGNGVALGLIAALVAWATRGDPVLGLLLCAAMTSPSATNAP